VKEEAAHHLSLYEAVALMLGVTRWTMENTTESEGPKTAPFTYCPVAGDPTRLLLRGQGCVDRSIGWVGSGGGGGGA